MPHTLQRLIFQRIALPVGNGGRLNVRPKQIAKSTSKHSFTAISSTQYSQDLKASGPIAERNNEQISIMIHALRTCIETENNPKPVSVSIIVPVYQGEKTLSALVQELEAFTETGTTNYGVSFLINEVVLVWDGAIDHSAEVINALAQKFTFVRPVWLSKNFGQHAATLAGISGCSGDWILTLDEDGLHNPSDLPRMLEEAVKGNYQLVYGVGSNIPPHGIMRNTASKFAHWIFLHLLGDNQINKFSSFRLIRGDLGRSLSAFCGNGIYLDVALCWVAGKSSSIPVTLRNEGRPATSYKWGSLFEHFQRMIFSSQRTPLRLTTFIGFLTVAFSGLLATYAFYQKIIGNVPIQGWTSIFILISFCFGILMLTLGIIAEYIGLILSLSMGKPLFLIQSNNYNPIGKR